ncbi:hypothetical protein [Ponticaulis sp.]|uniref:hypothetical protein n=1 Tax=Ponticaulis sp. TaxID=2020902 RepID=UPI000B6A78DA|nr:hypothetical protein [Ponticaulis sp.]MAI88951.1 hypothetical protein [Ponticaulis sp.]OUY01638.1 MAG: hypothetical protein CBB65_00535 [Hyphomonadaceae bacterium TMED5]|tara:strand:+ start:72278 stop:72907 length:630 start_codon:yes stop_codon:yes gene_type:complete
MPERSLEDSHSALMDDSAYQFELPVQEEAFQPQPPSEPSAFWMGVGDFLTAIAPVIKYLLIAAVVLLICYVLFVVVSSVANRRSLSLRRARGPKEDTLQDVDLRPDEAFVTDLLKQADAMAERGEYALAIRTILHSSFEEMKERIRDRIGISLTAREIGRLGQMPDASRTALHELIARVEISAFGGAEVGQEDYLAARREYEIFVRGEA